MVRRALHWLVLGFTTLWFGVLVPVHNRGEISLPGSERDARQTAHACCADSSSAARHAPGHAPAPSRGGACAVCSFIATLDAPPPVTWVETRLGLIGTLDAPRPDELPAARVVLPFHSRAPPAA
jgi:hypothetical protein